MTEVRRYLINYDGYELPQVITKQNYLQSWDKPEHHNDFIMWTSDWEILEELENDS